MKRAKRIETINQLKKAGFKVVTGFRFLYINPNGKVYSLKTGRYLKPNDRNYVNAGETILNLPKLILKEFANQPYSFGQITYIDGNRTNLNVKNLKYKRIFDKNAEPFFKKELLTAIRCYFQVKEGYKVQDSYKTKNYLQYITQQRHFFTLKKDLQYIEVFETYINGANRIKTAQKHCLGVRDCTVIISKFVNILTDDILFDLKTGILELKTYKPKPTTKTQIIKEYNKELIKRGQKPLPLRNKSHKENLKELQKIINQTRE